MQYQNIGETHIISTGEDPGLQIESFAVINLRGVSTNKKYYNIGEVNIILIKYFPICRRRRTQSIPWQGKK
jgi:hypothetical protein